jgi:dethiobiotin synthetase
VSVLFVTGTSTGVGKTVATAALATCALAANRPVTIVKLVQTGLPEGAPVTSPKRAV